MLSRSSQLQFTMERKNLLYWFFNNRLHVKIDKLFETLAKEQKTVFLLGDFSVDLLKYEQHKAEMNFLIPCHPICSYLILFNQLELLLTQRLSLIRSFPIIPLKI